MMWLKLKDGRHARRARARRSPTATTSTSSPSSSRSSTRWSSTAQALGLDMIQGDHEDAPGQIELNFGFDRAERTADNLSTFRQICRQVGRELSAFPCFMPKPFMGVSANGCHHNISLVAKGDENAFLPETDDPQLPSQLGLLRDRRHPRAPAGAHARHGPTVNSYRRLWDTGFWAPVFADWGYQNRTTALRVSAPGRFEYRSRRLGRQPVPLDGRADHGHAGRHRPRSSIPGPPEERNIYEAMEAGKKVKKIPMTFGDALDALEADEVVKSALPGEMYASSCTTSATSGSASARPSPTGTSSEYLDVLPVRKPETDHVRDRRDHLRGRDARRPRHDPDAPVDEAPRARLDRLRAVRPGLATRTSCATSSPTRTTRATSSSRTGSRHNRAEVERRLRQGRRAGPRRRAGDRLRLPRHASRTTATSRTLADFVEDVPRRRGALARPLARDRQGSRRRRDGRRRSTTSATSTARTRSATSGWRPSRTSTSRARTPTGRTRSPTSRSCTTAS